MDLVADQGKNMWPRGGSSIQQAFFGGGFALTGLRGGTGNGS